VKQVLQNLKNGETIVADVPAPVPREGMVLVQTAASLLSAGTERMVVSFAEKSLLGKVRARPDLMRQFVDKALRDGLATTVEAAFNRLDQPMTLGYSSAGTIVRLGEGVRGFQPGQRVACAGGGYAVHAEYAAVPVNLLASIPDGVDFDSAAFTTLAAIAMHGFRLGETQVGEKVAVIGLGLVGLLACGIAAAAGCSVFGVDLDPRRIALAEKMGATQAVLRADAESAAAAFGRGRGMDSILICADTSSADPVTLAGTIARDRARIVAVGAVDLSLPRKTYYEKELFFVNSRSYGPGRYDTYYEEGGQDYPIGYVRWTEGRNLEAVLDLLATGRLDVHPLISHRFDIEQAPRAYQLITGKIDEPFLGVLLTYPTKTPSAANVVEAILPPPTSPAGEGRTSARLLLDAVRLGVLGAGNFASVVLLPAMRNIPHLEMTGICSASGVSAQHAARKFGFRFTASSEDEIIESPHVNTVAVLTRHHLHARQVLASLKVGKHVFCEKPLVLKAEELDEIKVLMDRPDAPLLMVGFNRRFAPLAQVLAGFFAGRSEPMVVNYRVNAGYLPPSHWLHDPVQGGGRILGEGCQFIDFFTFLIGENPCVVSAQALPDGGRYRQDNAVLTFAYTDGSLATLTYLANGDKSMPKERVEVFCSGRSAVLDDFHSLDMWQHGQHKRQASWLRQDKGHHAEWEALCKAILENGLPPIPYNQLWGTARATLAACRALQSASRMVIE
jgi:predicted dehydrogenase/threonine dehydrogenase-like Zn-dependent dehydrogenase